MLSPDTEMELEEDLGFEKDDELKSTETRIRELRKKSDRTPEEEAEFSDLKKKHRGKLTSQIEEERLRARRNEERAERLERELEEMKQKQVKPEGKKQLVGQAETVVINGKEFYTDRGLVQLVNANSMTQEEAYDHQEERREEKAVARLKQDMLQQSDAQIREESKNKILGEYPHFAPNHPDHNPNDPLFKEANRLWRNGYVNNPRGLELAVEDAKRILGRDHKKADLTQDFSVTRNEEPATRGSDKARKVTLSDAESEIAWSYYRTQKNPRTGKSYTQSEALEAATKSKQSRNAARRI